MPICAMAANLSGHNLFIGVAADHRAVLPSGQMENPKGFERPSSVSVRVSRNEAFRPIDSAPCRGYNIPVSMKAFPPVALFIAAAAPLFAGELPSPCWRFLDSHCLECHDAQTKKGGLDLTRLKFDLKSPTNFSEWV